MGKKGGGMGISSVEAAAVRRFFLYISIMKYLFYLLAACLTIAGCKKEKSLPEGINIRIHNTTAYSFNNCTIDPLGTLSDNPGPSSHNYGTVGAGNYSGYSTFTTAYRYAWIKLVMNGKTYNLKPYDYAGETVLPFGKYAYKITYNAGVDIIGLELVEEY